MAAEKGDALGAPLSPITHCWSRMSQAPSALESLWKKISSFMAEKIPRKAFSTPPPPIKGNYLNLLPTTHAASQTRRWAPTRACWMRTFKLERLAKPRYSH